MPTLPVRWLNTTMNMRPSLTSPRGSFARSELSMTPTACDFRDVSGSVTAALRYVLSTYGIGISPNASAREAAFQAFNAAMTRPAQRAGILNALHAALVSMGATRSAACVRTNIG